MKTQPVLILGAGINGASLARELVLNQVPCWIVDRNDIASGATSKSSRLIHGGLRYLEFGEFRLVREALVERDRLLRLAPHFVRPLTFAVPIRSRGGGWTAAVKRLLGFRATNRTPRGLWLTRTGLRIYDAFSRRSPLPAHSVTHRRDDLEPRVADAYRWICRYADAQMQFPERYTIALLQDARKIATEQGLDFRVLTHHSARRSGKSVSLVDTQPPAVSTVQPASLEPPLIVNATGAWGDTTLSQLDIPSRQLFGGTKGSHFLIDSEDLRTALGDQAVYAETRDGRFVFVLPFGKHVLIGTTDDPFPDDPLQAVATPGEFNYLIDLVNDVFPDIRLTSADVVCHYSGVRPLPFAENLSPGAVSRDHHVELTEGEIPILTLIGGKLTTSRQLGEEVAEQVCARLGQSRQVSTRDRVIPGWRAEAGRGDELSEGQVPTMRKGDDRLEAASRESLDALAGSSFDAVVASLVSQEERKAIAGTLIPRGVARWVIRNEWVRSLADLVERRLMLVLTGQISPQTITELAELLVNEGLLDTAAAADEVARYREQLTCQYGYRW